MSPKEKCNYVLDTSTLLASPYSIFSFDEHNVLLMDRTLEVLSEKISTNKSAAEVLKLLSELGQQGNLWEGIKLKNGGTLKILSTKDVPACGDLNLDKPSERMIALCKHLESLKSSPINLLVSMDPVQRIRADHFDVLAEEYKTEAAQPYMGRREVSIEDGLLGKFYSEKTLNPADAGIVDLVVNEFFILHGLANPSTSALARFDGHRLVPLRYAGSRPYGVNPRNAGQQFALEALMTPVEEAPLVILQGPAGTAKTFLALAVGLEKSGLNCERTFRPFRRILAVRPNEVMDKDIGFLPGDETGKIGPLFRPIFDNLETLTKSEGGMEKDGIKLESSYTNELIAKDIVSLQALGYMRGRSITDTYMIFDEMQNSTPVQAFGLVSRAGEGSKIVICGDPEQIDNPFLDQKTNGLSYTADRMKGSEMCWTLTFTTDECVRSKLAMEAIRRMSPKGLGDIT